MAYSLSSLHLPNSAPRYFHRKGIGSRPSASGLIGRILLGLGVGGLAATAYAVVKYYRTRTLGARASVRTSARTSARESARTRSPAVAAPDSGSYQPREQVSMDWIVAGRGMDTLVPAAYSIPEAIPQPIPEPIPHPSVSEHASRNPGNFLDTGEAAQAAANIPPVESVFSDPAPGAGSALAPNPLAQPDAGFTSRPGSEPWADTVRRAMEKKPLNFGYDKSVWTAPLLSQYLMETHGVAVPVPQLRQALRKMGYLWKHTHYVQARSGAGRHH